MIDDLGIDFDEFELSDETETPKHKEEAKVSEDTQTEINKDNKQSGINGLIKALAMFLPPALSVTFFIIMWHAVKNVGNGNIDPIYLVLSFIFIGCFIWAIVDGIKNAFHRGKKIVKHVTKSIEAPRKKQQNTISKATDAKETSTAIKHYKNLYDNGVITKKEFEEKKRQLLNS